MSTDQLLATYLNDHLAGAVVGVELARRAARNNRGSTYQGVLERLAGEIDEDRQALEAIMSRLGIAKDPSKIALAWTAEKLGRLKLNGSFIGYSPLSRLEELEILSIGVAGKLLLWQTLSHTRAAAGHATSTDLAALMKRARSQSRRLERQRIKAADEALSRAQDR